MCSLPQPPEPSIDTLKKYAKNYEDGVNSFWPEQESVKTEIMAKQGMIGYLWNIWGDYDISYQEVQQAVGNANTPIDLWLDDAESWEYVITRLINTLDHTID